MNAPNERMPLPHSPQAVSTRLMANFDNSCGRLLEQPAPPQPREFTPKEGECSVQINTPSGRGFIGQKRGTNISDRQRPSEQITLTDVATLPFEELQVLLAHYAICDHRQS
jgi:hypothetical protein